jgi:hypothetical protein
MCKVRRITNVSSRNFAAVNGLLFWADGRLKITDALTGVLVASLDAPPESSVGSAWSSGTHVFALGHARVS